MAGGLVTTDGPDSQSIVHEWLFSRVCEQKRSSPSEGLFTGRVNHQKKRCRPGHSSIRHLSIDLLNLDLLQPADKSDLFAISPVSNR